MTRLPGFGDQLGGMQEGFRRDASPVQADSAEPFILLHQEDIPAMVSCIKCGSISSWTCSNDDDFGINRLHVLVLSWVDQFKFSAPASDLGLFLIERFKALHELFNKLSGLATVDDTVIVRKAEW